jgi:hypothetical protein
MNLIKWSLPNLVVLLWLTFLGLAVWQHAERSEQPPIFDAMNYVVKAKAFWKNLEEKQFENPFNLEITYRPPGTVLMSYPFGFNTDPRGFYFRSIFFPVIFFVFAIFVVLYSRGMSRSEKWNAALISIFLSTLPMFYHFEPSKDLISGTYWGLVDAFLAGIAALATAAWLRSVKYSSLGWLIAAGISAGFCLLIKPVGGLVMVLVGLSWLVAVLFRIRSDEQTKIHQRQLKRFLSLGLVILCVIYAVVLHTCFSSQYLSHENITWAAQGQAILRSESKSDLTLNSWSRLIHVSLGEMLPLVGAITSVFVILYWRRLVLPRAGSSKPLTGVAVACSLLYLSLGIWFWVAATGVSQVRYFYPFALMAITCILPLAMQIVEKIPRWGKVSFRVLCVFPTVNLALLLGQPNPPLDWQKLTGVNLSSGTHREEIKQARNLINKVRSEGKNSSLYSFYSGPAVYVFENVLLYEYVTAPSERGVDVRRPITWENPTTFHLDEILDSDYIVFEPVGTLSDKISVLSQRSIHNLSLETRLMHAWFTDLEEEDGIILFSNTPSLRLLEVSDRERLEASLEEMKNKYIWGPAFSKANAKRQSPRVSSRMSVNLSKANEIISRTVPEYRQIKFGDRFILLGQSAVKTIDGLRIHLLWKSLAAQKLSFVVAVHFLDEKGNVVFQADYTQDRVGSTVEPGAQWLDRIDVPKSKLENVVSAGVGLYSVPDIKLLPVEKGRRDLNGGRLLIALSGIR